MMKHPVSALPLQEMKAYFQGTPTVFLGELKGCELAAAYASADIFVMTSESETLGNVVGEVRHMACCRLGDTTIADGSMCI